MTDPKKPLEVTFAPGAFDHIELDSQEELTALMADIKNMFANMTPEELAAQSQPVDWDSLDDEERDILEQTLNNEPRNLQ